MAPKKLKATISVDDQLTDNLRIAEDALIGAVKLFSDHSELNRRVGYFPKLLRAQEAVTGLHREELVRVRGSMRPRGGKKR